MHLEEGGSPHDGIYVAPPPRVICEEYAGHEWAPAGNGMLICMRCRLEEWDDEVAGIDD